MKKLIIFSVVLFVISIACSEEITGNYVENPGSNNDEIIFLKRLRPLFQGREDLEANLNRLTEFSSEYPNSRFADDARFIPILLSFTGAAVGKDKKGSEMFIEYMERFVQGFPDSSLEDTTSKRLQELGMSTGAIYIPYNAIVSYMQGFLAFELGEFKIVEDRFSELKNSLNFDKDKSGVLTVEIYLPLAIAYKELGSDKEFSDLYDEVLRKFPGNDELLQFFNRLKGNSK